MDSALIAIAKYQQSEKGQDALAQGRDMKRRKRERMQHRAQLKAQKTQSVFKFGHI